MKHKELLICNSWMQ